MTLAPLALDRIVSGGQTGVDRAALDAALACGLRIGGWCPRGRRAEDGAIPEPYPLVETPSKDYEQRTKWNVRDSDATLILILAIGHFVTQPQGGTKLTGDVATRIKKPHHVAAVNRDSPQAVAYWLSAVNPAILNIAGPRESNAPGIYQLAYGFLVELFRIVEPRRRDF